jgi:hypothetical protein
MIVGHELLSSDGIVDELCFSYGSSECMDGSTDPPECLVDCDCGDDICSEPCSCPWTCEDSGVGLWNARGWRISDYEYGIGGFVNSHDEVKKSLVCEGPLITDSADWDHDYIIIGWDTDSPVCRRAYSQDSCWIIKNSHGVRPPGWATGGDGTAYWSALGLVYIPFEDHEYSVPTRYGIRYIETVYAPSSTNWPEWPPRELESDD